MYCLAGSQCLFAIFQTVLLHVWVTQNSLHRSCKLSRVDWHINWYSHLSFHSSTWLVTWGHCWCCCGNHHWASIDCWLLLHCLLLWSTCSRYVNMFTGGVWYGTFTFKYFPGKGLQCESSAVSPCATELSLNSNIYEEHSHDKGTSSDNLYDKQDENNA